MKIQLVGSEILREQNLKIDSCYYLEDKRLLLGNCCVCMDDASSVYFLLVISKDEIKNQVCLKVLDKQFTYDQLFKQILHNNPRVVFELDITGSRSSELKVLHQLLTVFKNETAVLLLDEAIKIANFNDHCFKVETILRLNNISPQIKKMEIKPVDDIKKPSIYLFIANEKARSWHKHGQLFFYDNSKINSLDSNDLVYFIFNDRVDLALKQTGRKLFQIQYRFEPNQGVANIVGLYAANKRNVPLLTSNQKLIDLSLIAPNSVEILPVLSTELRMLFGNEHEITKNENLIVTDPLIDSFFDGRLNDVFLFLKDKGRYSNRIIYEALKILEPEAFQIAENALGKYIEKLNTLKVLISEYDTLFSQTSGNSDVLDYLPHTEELFKATEGLKASNILTNVEIFEILQNKFPNETDAAVSEFIASGKNSENQLASLHLQIDTLQEELKREHKKPFIQNEGDENYKTIPATVIPKKTTINSLYKLNKIYDIINFRSNIVLNLEHNIYKNIDSKVLVFIGKKGIVQKEEREYVIIGEGLRDSQHFGKNINSKIKDDNYPIYIFETLDHQTCKFKGVAKYVSHRSEKDNRGRTLILFTVQFLTS